MNYRVQISCNKILVVGAGGTGSLVVDGLCRLLVGHEEAPLFIIDPDRVEAQNVRRQNFYLGDIGKFKSQVLAERYSRLYGRQIAYSVYPFERDMVEHGNGQFHSELAVNALIIGCVDNYMARRSIAESIKSLNWWLDAGNSYHSGQVLFGNVESLESMVNTFDDKLGIVKHLPMPSVQMPELLMPSPLPVKQQDCADAVEDNLQSPVINHAMATLVLEFVHRIITNKLEWMGAYLDMEAGTLKTVPISEVTVSRMLSMQVNDLKYCPNRKF